jgi:hypothetical protein
VYCIKSFLNYFQFLFFEILNIKYCIKINRIQKLDRFLSCIIFLIHIKKIKNIDEIIYLLLCLIIFKLRVGYREKWLINNKKRYIIPHSLFRFLSYCFIMKCNNKELKIEITLLSWFLIYLFAKY